MSIAQSRRPFASALGTSKSSILPRKGVNQTWPYTPLQWVSVLLGAWVNFWQKPHRFTRPKCCLLFHRTDMQGRMPAGHMSCDIYCIPPGESLRAENQHHVQTVEHKSITAWSLCHIMLRVFFSLLFFLSPRKGGFRTPAQSHVALQLIVDCWAVTLTDSSFVKFTWELRTMMRETKYKNLSIKRWYFPAWLTSHCSGSSLWH